MKRVIHFLLMFFSITGILYAEYTKKIVFSAGTPLDNYQARVITPLLKEAFKRNNIEFEVISSPSLRSLKLSNQGRVDGELHRVYEFHAITSNKYSNLIRIESQLLSVWLTAFSTEKIALEHWTDLKKYHVGYYRGRKNVESILNNILPKEQIHSVTTDIQAFKMLSTGRTDIVISESREGNSVIKNNKAYSDIFEIAKIQETKIYAYIHKKHKALALKIANTLEDMKEDGTFLRIISENN